MDRIIKAFFHSLAGIRHGLATEQAIRQEAFVLALAVPVAFLLTGDPWKWFALIGVLLLLLSVEFLNTALEELADHVTPEQHPVIKSIKDLGSAAVFMLLVLSGAIWSLAVIERLAALAAV